jgi:hypothetical protein
MILDDDNASFAYFYDFSASTGQGSSIVQLRLQLH